MTCDVAFGTRHRKELVVAGVLQPAGFRVVVPPDFPSDDFGTFTRERERPASQLETARLKALAAAKRLGLSKGLASEGSYGPHPVVPFAGMGRELVLLVDLEQDWEVEGWWSGHRTNFLSGWARDLDEVDGFASRARFPSHALVVRAGPEQTSPLNKGLRSRDELHAAARPVLDDHGKVFLETDMRALFNPTRMEAIRLAAQDLVIALKSLCPQCDKPGFRVRDVVRGLPCAWCAMPTGLVKVEILQCRSCGANRQRPRADKTHAEPGECPFCNP